MNDTPQPGSERRYRWPWYVLGGVLLAIVLAVLWMSVAVRRVQQYRDPDAGPFPAARTNSAPTSTNGR